MPHKKRTPMLNVYWKDLPTKACVEDRGHLFVATRRDGKKAVVFWEGRDASVAQRFLAARARKGCRR